MKNITFSMALIFASSMAFGQYWGPSPALTQQGQRSTQPPTAKKRTAQTTVAHPAASAPSALDKAIEQRVNVVAEAQVVRSQQASVGTPGNKKKPNITANSDDSREVYLNGQRFRLRQKQTTYWGASSSDKIHTYTNDTGNDTIQVYKRHDLIYDDGTGEPYGLYQVGYSAKNSLRQTSDETKKNADGTTDNMSACEEKNADGSCRYVVKRTVASGSLQDNKVPGTIVVIKRNFPSGTSPEVQAHIKRGTYQSLKNTNLQQTFGRNFKKVGQNDIYGPETYPN